MKLIILLLLSMNAIAFDRAIVISESTFTGNNAILVPTQMAGYLLTQKSGVYIHDLSMPGAMICRHSGFPLSAVASGINDNRNGITTILASYVLILRGTNDYDNAKDLQEVKAELKAFAMYAQGQGKTVVIISPLSTLNESIDRPLLQSWRDAYSTLASSIGAEYIDGRTLLDINNPLYWEDGAHPSVLGMDILTTNIKLAMNARGFWL